jgi:hypothetical protein
LRPQKEKKRKKKEEKILLVITGSSISLFSGVIKSILWREFHMALKP